MNSTGDTPLHSAIVLNFEELIYILIENGADINMKNKTGCTPLFSALRRNLIKIVQILI